MVKIDIDAAEGIEFEIENNSLTIKGKEGIVKKSFRKDIKMHKEGSVIVLEMGETANERKNLSWPQRRTLRI